ncbi:SAG1386/EF1546 family surface-associated protein [Streptococcus halotolerans]|uniref:SAG1386/EF1546 family surface-associated protein n=1 Tax=Streptococcus halotolerans TaxID=1814128 RepID=UPI000786E4F1|nr:SAG1386/EF1546 family surface-associated protein [Streptococcus halotolerans]
MAKKPWESKIFENKKDSGRQTSRKEKNSGLLSTPLLTGLLSVFFLIVVGILIVVFYTSNGGSDEAKATSGFYRSSQSKAKEEKEAKTSKAKSESDKKAKSSKADAKKSKKKAASKASKKEKSKNSSAKASSSATSSSETAMSSSTTVTEETTPSTEPSTGGQTIVVQAGEGAASIAARAGISIEQLQALNPQNMTMGYWYANPGDQVNIN